MAERETTLTGELRHQSSLACKDVSMYAVCVLPFCCGAEKWKHYKSVCPVIAKPQFCGGPLELLPLS